MNHSEKNRPPSQNVVTACEMYRCTFMTWQVEEFKRCVFHQHSLTQELGRRGVFFFYLIIFILQFETRTQIFQKDLKTFLFFTSVIVSHQTKIHTSVFILALVTRLGLLLHKWQRQCGTARRPVCLWLCWAVKVSEVTLVATFRPSVWWLWCLPSCSWQPHKFPHGVRIRPVSCLVKNTENVTDQLH